MNELTLEWNSEINLEVLTKELRSAEPNSTGITQFEDTLIVHGGESGELDEQLVRAVLEAHDPSVKSADQLAQEALQQIRYHFIAEPLEVDSFGSADQPLRQLAERVAWLEREIARLVQ